MVKTSFSFFCGGVSISRIHLTFISLVHEKKTTFASECKLASRITIDAGLAVVTEPD